MKKTFLTLICLSAMNFMSEAQTTLANTAKVRAHKAISAKKSQQKFDGFEAIYKKSVPPSAASRALGYVIGNTDYDLGSNGAVKPRLVNFGNKKLSGAFTFGSGDIGGGVPNRGSGYNTTGANGKFGNAPLKRVETERTGFTNLCADSEGNEYLFAHRATAAGYDILMSKKLKGATQWVETPVPTDLAAGMLWSSAAIGGANGKTIHLVALSTLVTFSGPRIGDIDGVMMYYRSTDGGATWDKKDVIMPGIDSTRYDHMNGDSYSISVKGDKVAIAAYGDWFDTDVWISNNNGDSFTRTNVWDFPIDAYKIDDLYTVDDIKIGTDPDPNAPNELAIRSTDGTGTVFIDNNNKTHVIIGSMYVLDDEVDAGGSSFFPNTNGFYHWDENTPDSLYFIDAYPDLNANDSIDLVGIGTYFNCLTWTPTLAQGADNTLYLGYTAPSEKEDYVHDDINSRHVFIMHSKDGGKNWSKPYDVIDDKTLFDAIEFQQDLAECTFPYLALNVDSDLHLIYQQDYTGGIHVSVPATIPVEENNHIYVSIPTSRITAAKDVVAAEAVKFEIYPNPAKDRVQLTFDVAEAGNVKINLYDLTGRLIQKNDLGTQNIGKQSVSLPFQLNAGVYFVQLEMNNAIATQRLMVK